MKTGEIAVIVIVGIILLFGWFLSIKAIVDSWNHFEKPNIALLSLGIIGTTLIPLIGYIIIFLYFKGDINKNNNEKPSETKYDLKKKVKIFNREELKSIKSNW